MTTPIELDAAWLQPGSTVPVDAATTGRLVQAVRMLAAERERLRHSNEAQRAKLADVERRLRNQRDHINRLRVKAGESCN